MKTREIRSVGHWNHVVRGSQADEIQRPNVLFLIVDQQRHDTIAALGNPHIYTPNLDRLASAGWCSSTAIRPVRTRAGSLYDPHRLSTAHDPRVFQRLFKTGNRAGGHDDRTLWGPHPGRNHEGPGLSLRHRKVPYLPEK